MLPENAVIVARSHTLKISFVFIQSDIFLFIFIHLLIFMEKKIRFYLKLLTRIARGDLISIHFMIQAAYYKNIKHYHTYLEL